MKTIKVKFVLAISLVNCKVEDIVSINVEDDATSDEIDNKITEEYSNWVHENNQGYFEIID